MTDREIQLAHSLEVMTRLCEEAHKMLNCVFVDYVTPWEVEEAQMLRTRLENNVGCAERVLRGEVNAR
jgi:hypothetical protein